MSNFTDNFAALNLLIEGLGNSPIAAGKSYNLARTNQLQKVGSIFNLSAIANGQSIAFNSTTKTFIPASFALTSHTHTEFAPTTHTHAEYALANHTHPVDGVYAAVDHTHSGYAPTNHTHLIADLPALLGNAIASNAQRLFWASPNSGSGTPTFRAILDSDIPTSFPRLNATNTFTKAQRSQIVTLSIVGGTVTLNPSDSNDFVVELSETATLVISGGTASDSFRLTVIQTAIGGRILTLPNGTKMQGGVAVSYSGSPGAIDKLYFDTHNGTTWCCSFANFG